MCISVLYVHLFNAGYRSSKMVTRWKRPETRQQVENATRRHRPRLSRVLPLHEPLRIGHTMRLLLWLPEGNNNNKRVHVVQ
jgi:hypothetical protein